MSQMEQGVAFLCDEVGRISTVLRDDFQLFKSTIQGLPFSTQLDRESIKKSLLFMQEIKSEGATFGWDMNLLFHNQIVTLHFSGAHVQDHYLVVGALSLSQSLILLEELMKINNDHVNVIRELRKMQSRIEKSQGDDASHMEHMYSMNNDLVSLQRELTKKNNELQLLHDQKNQFIGMVAHDLRNPLGVIMAFSEFLLNELTPQLSERHLRFLTNIKKTSRFMHELVEDILDISKIESGNLNLKNEYCDIVDFLKNIVDMNAVLAQAKEIEIKVSMPDEPIELEFDALKIEQVINNLISNAIKFSQRGSSIEVYLAKEENQVKISVVDHGQGIPQNESKEVFKPFRKSLVRATEGEKSTGLGLAICRNIVEGHNGRLGIISDYGHGATFYFTLPYATSDAGPVSP